MKQRQDYWFQNAVLFAILCGLVAGHVYMGLIHPATRHARHAMWGGFVRLDWVARHHRAWAADLPRTGDPEEKLAEAAQSAPPPSHPGEAQMPEEPEVPASESERVEKAPGETGEKG